MSDEEQMQAWRRHAHVQAEAFAAARQREGFIVERSDDPLMGQDQVTWYKLYQGTEDASTLDVITFGYDERKPDAWPPADEVVATRGWFADAILAARYPRGSDYSEAVSHARAVNAFRAGRLTRSEGQALCSPYWGPDAWAEDPAQRPEYPTCPRCVDLVKRHMLAMATPPKH